jgi:hypothetical protein
MKKYGLPSVETVAVMPTRASMEKALSDGGERALRLMHNIGLDIVDGKTMKIARGVQGRVRQ